MLERDQGYQRVLLALMGVRLGVWGGEKVRYLTKVTFVLFGFVLLVSPALMVAAYLKAGGGLYSQLTTVTLFTGVLVTAIKFTAVHRYKTGLNEAFDCLSDDRDYDTPGSVFTRQLLFALRAVTALVVLFYAHNPLAGERHRNVFRSAFDFGTDPGLLITLDASIILTTGTVFVVNIGIDSVVVFLTCRISNRLEALGRKMETLGTGRAETQLRIVQDCVKEHVLLLRMMSVFENLVSVIALLIVVLTVVISCSAIVAVLNIDNKMNGLGNFSIFFSNLMHIFLYCRIGQQITDSTARLHWACYNNCWYNCTIEVKKSLLVILSVTLRPKKIRGGYVFNMSYRMFWKIVSEIYSYTMILVSLI